MTAVAWFMVVVCSLILLVVALAPLFVSERGACPCGECCGSPICCDCADCDAKVRGGGAA